MRSLPPLSLPSMAATALSNPTKAAAFLLLLVSTLAADEPLSLLERQEAQLRRLEALADSLSATLARLEASTLPLSLPPPPPASSPEAAAGAAATRHRPAWSDRFHFAASARLPVSATPTAASTLPYEDLNGVARYFALGDSLGRCHVFSATGDLVLQLPSLSDSPVTSLLSYVPSNRKREAFLLSGHADGSIAAHRLYESAPTIGAAADRASLSLTSSRPLTRGAPDPALVALETHQAGRVRYVLAADAGGRIRVFKEDGALYGAAAASSKPLAFAARGRLLFLTESGAASLDLRTMLVRETECDGLNGSLVTAYSFDVAERSKAYGITAEGDLFHILLLGDAANLKCRVRAIRKSEIDGPAAILNIRGYLLVAAHDKVLVYNVSTQYYGRAGAPRLLFVTEISEIKSVFLNTDVGSHELVATAEMVKPLIASDREKLVVLGLGSGYVGIYRANFPVFKVESNAVVWSGPALLFLLFLIAIWHFYVKKKDALGWTPEETFNTSPTATAGLLGPGPSDRAFADSSRPSDLRDLRGGGLRAPTRRYVSPPSRYPTGSSIPFRPGTADPNFRGGADLKYRGQSIETSAFPKRREPLFANAQIAEDHDD